MSSGVGDGASIELAGVGVLRFVFSTRRSGFRSAAISSNLGLMTKKNTPASAPPLRKRNRRIPAIIHGNFDFFCATGGGKGVEGAGVAIAGAGCGAMISPVVVFGASAAGGGGGGGGGVGGGGCCLAMSDVVGGTPAGPVVGPVLRGNATVVG